MISTKEYFLKREKERKKIMSARIAQLVLGLSIIEVIVFLDYIIFTYNPQGLLVNITLMAAFFGLVFFLLYLVFFMQEIKDEARRKITTLEKQKPSACLLRVRR